MNQDKYSKVKIKIIVVGGGPAGVQAALRAKELGADVTIIESNRLGGTAFNEGPARFVDKTTLEIEDGRQFSADKIILAVGGKPRKLSIPGNELGLSFHDLWGMKTLPQRVTVVGGSATGCQLASILINFGVEVDVIEFANRLTPPSDIDLSSRLESAFIKRGMNVLTETGCDSIEKEKGKLKVSFIKNGEKGALITDAVFLMVGWPANLSGLNLDVTGVELNGPYIKVDDYLQTNVPEILVAGDANGVSMFVQSAAHQARIAAQNAVSGPEKVYVPQAIATGSFT